MSLLVHTFYLQCVIVPDPPQDEPGERYDQTQRESSGTGTDCAAIGDVRRDDANEAGAESVYPDRYPSIYVVCSQSNARPVVESLAKFSLEHILGAVSTDGS